MSLRLHSRLERVLVLLIVALAAIYVVSLFALAGARLVYPYEVDPLEGNMLAMTLRVLDGAPLYTAPSIDYTAFCYPPLYFHAAAAVMRLIGPGYAALRVVSLIATIATLSTIYVVLRRERVRPWLGLVMVAMFAGADARTHHVGDAGRVDALALALAFGSLAILFSGHTRRGAAIAGCLGGLAILAKQPMIVLIACAAIYQLVHGPRLRVVIFIVTSAATAVIVLAAMGLLFDPWLTFYCLDVPGSHHLRAWDLAVLGPVFVVTTLPIALGAPLVHARSLRRWLSDPWSAATVAYLTMSLLARAKEGGSANVFLPLVALAAIQLGRYLEHIRNHLPRASLALLAGQLALLWWSPLSILPTARDVATGDRVVAELAGVPGDVYVPAFPAYAVMAGKPWHAHYVALCDLARIDPGMRVELARQLASRRFAAVVSPDSLDPCVLPGLTDHYRQTGALDVSPAPSDLAALVGGPQLFEIVHGGKLNAIFR
jgi:hypothetical protein